MFKAQDIASVFHDLIGWKQHYDTNEINLPPELTDTVSGEYYQQKHPALRLDIINATIPDGYTLEDYLKDKVRDASIEMLNDVVTARQLEKYGKSLLSESVLLNKYGWLNDKITNESRFVGFQITLNTAVGLKAIINQIGLQFSGAESFKVYLFHTSNNVALTDFDVTADGTGKWTWTATNEDLNSFSEQYKGGSFLLGYYQDDVATNAINNTDFNFDRGACGSCNKSYYNSWRDINAYYTVYPFYFANGDYAVGEMPDLNDITYTPDVSFGLNLKLSVQCDLTRFFITNKMAFVNLLGLKVTRIILRDMQYSQEINYIEENLKMMIIRDLEGDTETKRDNITQQYQKALKSINFNISGINEVCLPCEDEGYAPTYDVI